MRIMKVFPMHNKGSKIEISFTDIHFSSKNTLKGVFVNYGLEGGSRVTLAFDCEKEKFIVEDVELWGI